MADTASASYIEFTNAGGSWCTGVNAFWNGAALGLVTDIDVNVGGSLPLGRDSTFAVDAGTISFKCLSTAAIGLSQYGLQGTLDITGGGLTMTHKAICQTLTMTGRVNDVAKYGAVFKLVRQ
jgi:hypothetical protein